MCIPVMITLCFPAHGKLVHAGQILSLQSIPLMLCDVTHVDDWLCCCNAVVMHVWLGVATCPGLCKHVETTL